MSAVPTWGLRWILGSTLMRGFWAEAWIELYAREVLGAVDDAADHERGPWAVTIPTGRN